MLFGILPGQYTVANASGLEDEAEVGVINNDNMLVSSEDYFIEPVTASGSAVVLHKWDIKSLGDIEKDEVPLAKGVYEVYFKVVGIVKQRTSNKDSKDVKSLEVGK